MNKRFVPGKKDIEKLNKYLKNGKDIKPIDARIRNHSERPSTNK